MRVSELTGLKFIHLGTAPHVACTGKGRKDRITPLDRQTVQVLRAHAAERSTPQAFVFPTRAGTQMSRDAVSARLALHTAAAAQACPSMTRKKVTAHVLRHTAAMRLLAAGIDSTVIALWLGHESIQTTQIYLHANMKTKEAALARTKPTGAKPGRYKVVDDALLAFLQAL
jgi:site-specific recombinase XerD